MKFVFRLALFAAVLTLPFAVPASAQYMYMDSNGNGIHDTGDRLNANNDSTIVDIYLVTNMNKDGSVAGCNTVPGTAMDINSYAFNIVATGGTATYGNYINRQATAFPNQAQTLNTGDGTFKTGFYAFTYTPAGLFRLGTLTITGTGGSPKIGFVDILPASQDFTSFGTPCPGIAGDNTYRLDGPNTQAFYGGPGDWLIAEGLDAAPGGNNPPVVTNPGNKTVNELAPLTFTVTATDPDAGQTVSFSLDAATVTNGATIGSASGVFSWTPTEAEGPGNYPVTVTATDSGSPSASSSAGFSITVNEVNQAPVLAAIGDKTVTVNSPLTFTATATDADLPGNGKSFGLTGAPAGATISASTGIFNWTPAATGTFPLTVTVTDDGVPPLGDSEGITITVSAGANQPPVLAAIGNKSIAELASLAFTATANDPDAGQTLTFSLDAGSPAGAAITGAGAFSWTPTEAQGPGSYPVTIRVTDSGSPAMEDFEAISIAVSEVNVAPVLAAIGDKATTVGGAVAFTATATDADVPANTLAFSLDAGAPAGAAIGATTGVFSFTPSASGTFPVTVRVTDNGTPPLSDFEAISIVVSAAANVNPVLAPIGNKTVDEEATLSFTATATDADAGQTLTFSLDAGAPAGASINASTGAFSWTPAEADGPGSHSITVRVTDDGTPNLGDSETISVTVNEVNVAPVLAAIGDKAGTVGVEVAFTATATDADVPANTLTFSLDAGAPAGATINGSTGAFSWTPSATGSFAVTIRVTDNGTPALDDFEAISINVGAGVVNHAPVLAAIGNKTVDEGTPLTFTATATDADAGQTLAFSLDSGAPSGAAITAAGGVFSWTPGEADGPGSHPVTVRVTDNGSPAMDAFEAISITVNEVNVAPVLAAIGNKAGTVGVEVAFTATATDADVPANTLTFSLDAGGPAGATINGSTGAFSWTPSATGSFAATVRVTDNGAPALDDFEAITIDVTEAAVNHAPVLDAIGNKAVDEGLLLSFTATATDADAGQTLTFSLDTGGPSGAAITAGGVFSWTPTEAQGPGSYPVTIRVTDDGSPAMDDFEVVTIDVNEVNVAPVLAAIGNKAGTVGVEVAFTASATDADVPANALTFSLDAGAPAGAAINGSTGAFSWTPSATGSFAATVRVTDNGTPALDDFEAISIDVTEAVVNHAPVLDAIGNKSGTVGVEVAFTATATDADAGQTLAFSLDAGAPAGAAINGSTGAFSWTPSATGSFAATVRVTDNGTPALDDFEAITITVGGGGGETLAANAFFAGPNIITVLDANRATCVEIEPVQNSYSNDDVDLSSIVMIYAGKQISALADRTDLNGDKNHNGVREIKACFSKEDLRSLFSDLPRGLSRVEVAIEGNLESGARFGDTVNHFVFVFSTSSTGRCGLAAQPNPLNPETILSFTTTQRGPVTVRVFDTSGRLVKTLQDGTMPAGFNSVRWDGSADNGTHVATGVYFVKMISLDGEQRLRVTVLK